MFHQNRMKNFRMSKYWTEYRIGIFQEKKNPSYFSTSLLRILSKKISGGRVNYQ